MSNNPFHPFFGYNRGYDPDMDQVALFIDWDNLVISNYADRGVNRPDLELIVRKAQQYGTLVMARAYAEWQVLVDRLEVYKTGVEPIYAPVFHSNNDLSGQMGRGKSLADPIMVTDCIDFLHLMPQIGTYVLVTGDKDMMPVVRLAKMRGRRVIVIGPDYVANVLQQVSDEFIPYRQLLAQGAYEQYAAYGYTPNGNGAYPPANASQLPQQNVPYNQSNFPPTGASAAQSSNERDRRGRRLTGSQSRSRTGQAGYSSQSQASYNQTPMPPSSYQPETIGGYTTQPTAYPQYPGVPLPPQTASGQVPNNQYGQYGSAQPSYNQPLPGAVPPTQGYAQPSSYLQPGSYTPPPATASPTQSGQPAYQGYQPTPLPPTTYQQPTYTPTTPVPTSPSPTKAPAANERVVGSSYAPPAQPAPAAVSSTPTQPEAPRGKAANDFEDIKDLVHNILSQKLASGRGHLRARDLKEEILRRLPNFNERRYGFAKFKAMLSAIEQSGVIQTEQADHIVWVSLPGSPKLPAEVMSDLERQHLSPGGTIMTDDSEDEGDEGEDRPEAGGLEAATAAEPSVPSLADTSDPFVASVVLDSEAALEVATQAPDPVQPTAPRRDSGSNRAAEERKTVLAEAAIGAYREQMQREAATAVVATPAVVATSAATAGNTGPTFPELGPKPALLEQPFFYDVIVMIDGLRYRNRWLGYELLLSSVRDYLSKQMSESEAKNQAGTILSRLLSEGVLKPSQEIHSRGPRKMRVLVQHLQEDNRAVKYALAAAKLIEQQRKAQTLAAAQPPALLEIATAASEPRQSRVHRLLLTTPHSAEVEAALAAETAAIAAPAEAQPEAAVAESPALASQGEMPSSMLPTGVIEERQTASTSASEPETASPADVQPVGYEQLVEAAAPHEAQPDGNAPDAVTASHAETATDNQPQVEATVSDSQPQPEGPGQDTIPGLDFPNPTEDVGQVEQELLQRAAEAMAHSSQNEGDTPVGVVATLVETVPQPGDNDALPPTVVLISGQPEAVETTEEPADESEEVEAEPEGEVLVAAPTRRPRRRRSSPAVSKVPTPAGDELA